MELIRISDSQLKIMLSAEDMRNYEFDDVDAIHAGEAFRNLMREAKKRCGFNALDGRIYVQLYRSRAGGGEMFVTKLSKSDSGEGIDAFDEEEETMRVEYGRRAAEKSFPDGGAIYRFAEMQQLLSVCGVLRASRYDGKSAAYVEKENGSFFLILDEETNVAGEHFGRLCPGSFYYYINERCEALCDDAVGVLGRLA